MGRKSDAAVLDRRGGVLALAKLRRGTRTIDIAVARTVAGEPVRVNTHKVSRSMRNLAAARRQCVWAIRYAHKDRCFYMLSGPPRIW